MTPLKLPAELKEIASTLREVVVDAGRAVLDRESGRCHEVILYRGYGTRERVWVHGRALECPGIAASAAEDPGWRNLLNAYRRIESDPLPHAKVRVKVGGADHELEADDEGFFGAWVPLTPPLPDDTTVHAVGATLVAPLYPGEAPRSAVGQVFTPHRDASYIVVSDLDDTVIQSHITNFVRAARTVLLGNARTRLPFPGVVKFYQALEQGVMDATPNAIFYLSSSPWNLYDVITDFLTIQTIPAGPVLLRDWDFNREFLGHGRQLAYKGRILRELFATYPDAKFILIGDSSEQDPEIYGTMVEDHPDRVLAIYIRNVQRRADRVAAVNALAEQVIAARSALVLADDTLAAARHAAEHGWIDPSSLAGIGEEKKADEGVTNEKADAPGVQTEQAPTVVVEDGAAESR